ncbi:MAG: hypothetical protein ACLQUY_00030 [Ktedonobacterales bacterium]
MPQPRRPFWQRRPFWLAVVVLLGVGGGVLWHIQSSSWTRCSDTQFPFRVQVLPAWHAGAWENLDVDTVRDCSHDVDLLPPSTTATASRAAETREPELISIVVNISCPAFGLSANPYLTQNPMPLSISGSSASLYDNTAHPGEKIALAIFGGHNYFFGLRRPLDKVTPDTALFMHVLQSFHYTGDE